MGRQLIVATVDKRSWHLRILSRLLYGSMLSFVEMLPKSIQNNRIQKMKKCQIDDVAQLFSLGRVTDEVNNSDVKNANGEIPWIQAENIHGDLHKQLQKIESLMRELGTKLDHGDFPCERKIRENAQFE